MKIYKYPKKEQWAEIVERPRLDLTKLNETVSTVLADIRERGDEAVREYELKFDKVRLSTLAVTEQEMDEAELLVSNELRDAIILAHHNIKVFHISQRFVGQKVKTQEGVTCWQKSVAIERVGLYIPGGTAPLFSTVLMLATPARIAGCKEIVLCTPPDKEGKVNPAILVAARIAGVSKIYKIGGVQAIGAMAYGTETVPKVFKIFGPGNQYVMAAKQHVSLDEVAIDMPAGPSEVCVLADETARAEFVAADLLSQAEHGIDSQVLFITTSESKLDEVHAELDRQLALLPRQEIAARALAGSLRLRECRRLCQRHQPHVAYARLCHGIQRCQPGLVLPQDYVPAPDGGRHPPHWPRRGADGRGRAAGCAQERDDGANEDFEL